MPVCFFANNRGFAKKTLLRTAKKAGLKPKSPKQKKYAYPTDGPLRSRTSPSHLSLQHGESLETMRMGLSATQDELSGIPFLYLSGIPFLYSHQS